jgi:formate dehydrogenase subunit gamma
VRAVGRTIVREHELLRHPVSTRLLHWGSAIFFILALLSGFALYSPWLFRWLTPLFGGGSLTRVLHPWFSLVFVALFAAQCVHWWRPMAWTRADSQWLGHIRTYVTNSQSVEPGYVDFFNGGQKLYFWAIVGSAAVFLISGIPLWFPATFGRSAAAIAYVFHDIAALVMLVGFIVHIYEASAAQPGTLHSMMRGTVDERWAWTHHPAWYSRATGRDAKADYEAAVERQTLAARDSRAS